MGCRDPKLRFQITDVVKSTRAIEILRSSPAGSVIAFDEAQYFQPILVEEWVKAADRGVYVIVGMPSAAQMSLFTKFDVAPLNLNSECQICGKEKSALVIYQKTLKEPTLVCESCEHDYSDRTIAELLAEVEASDPFKGEKKTYQPFYNIPMEGWTFVRGDSPARFDIIREAISKVPGLVADPRNPGRELKYVDVGCCSGFFCDAMTSIGYTATGVDVTKNFIDWASRVALFKRQSIQYLRQDAEEFLTSSDSLFDVTSSFATIQWVMAQRNYEAGVNCFKKLFDRTRHVCIVEMGYSTEEIYKSKILDRPSDIDKSWVLDIMKTHGNFADIAFYPAGHKGIWRDIFVGFKQMPGDPAEISMSDRVTAFVRRSSLAKTLARRLTRG